MDLAFVDKLANQNNGIKYLLVAGDVFSRSVRIQTMKTKFAKDTLQAFRNRISRKNTPEKLWLIEEHNIGEFSKKICKEKDIEVYSTMSETMSESRESNSIFKTYDISLHCRSW